MPEKKKKDLITAITLVEAAKKYNVTYNTLRNLGVSGAIVMTRRAGVLFLDEDSLKSYFETKELLKKHDEYLDKMIAEKEEEVDNTIAVYDDYLFSMRKLEKITKIFPVIINELSLLIQNPRTRDIFVSIALGKDIYKVAHQYLLSYDHVCATYTHAIDIVERRGGLLEKWKIIIQELEKRARILEFNNKNLNDQIQRLIKTEGTSIIINNIGYIPEEVLNQLSLSLKDNFELDLRIINSLHNSEIYTLEDLLRYISIHDGTFASLLNIENFGPGCLKKLKSILLTHKIINSNGDCSLLKYLI